MVGRAFVLGGLLLGTISAKPVAVPATATVESNAAGAEVATIARGLSVDNKIDTVAVWAREWFGTADAPILAGRDVDANTVIDKVAGWTKDWYHTDETDAVAKRAVDTDDVVDTVASWTKDWLHAGGESTQHARAVQDGETVDETIDRVAGKVKNYFQQGGSISARDLGLNFSSVIQEIFGFLEGLNWNGIIKTVMGWLQNVDFSSIIDGVLRWLDSTFFGGSSSPSPTPSAAAAINSRSSDIDWSSVVQRGLIWSESLF